MINIFSVQYNGGLVPDIILWALCDYNGEAFNAMSVCPYSQCSLLNLLTCLEGLDALILFFGQKKLLQVYGRYSTLWAYCKTKT